MRVIGGMNIVQIFWVSLFMFTICLGCAAEPTWVHRVKVSDFNAGFKVLKKSGKSMLRRLEPKGESKDGRRMK